MYEEKYFQILFEEDMGYYHELVNKYQNDERIVFMSELWNE